MDSINELKNDNLTWGEDIIVVVSILTTRAHCRNECRKPDSHFRMLG